MMRLLQLFILCAGFIVQAQVKFETAVSRDKIGKKENLRVQFAMNVQGDQFDPPSFDGFDVVAGPSTSVQQSFINGRASYQLAYTYVIRPKRSGKIAIGSAVMTYDSKEYKTDPYTITVTTNDSESPQNPVTSNSRYGNYPYGNPYGGNPYGNDPNAGRNDPSTSNIKASNNVHLVAEVTNGNPYLNEPTRVVYKIYVSQNVGVAGWTESKSPKYQDFWTFNIDNRNRQVQQGTYNGEPYRYLVLREAVLYPQKTGKLVIEPLELNVEVEVPSGRRDYRGNPYFDKQIMKLAAPAKTIVVKDFGNTKPTNFTGAVGNLKLEVLVDKTELKAGESLTAKVQVSGAGNLKLLEMPKLVLPQGLEVYEPARVDKVTTTINGMSGSIIDEYSIVPQQGGKYIIPAMTLSYFNPATKSFETQTTQEQTIQVTGGAVAANSTNSSRNEIKKVEPFVFIKTDTSLEDKNPNYFFNSVTHWLVLFLMVLALPIALLIRNRKNSMASDIVGNRIRSANKLSRKYLSDASKKIGDQEAFYVSLEKSLHNYLKSKLNLQTTEMSKDRVDILLADRQANEQTRIDFIQLLATCEFARYAPSNIENMKQDYEKASTVINALDKQLKK